MAQQTDDFSLRLGYWTAQHRDQLRTWWAITIMLVDVSLLVYFVFTFATYSFSTVKTVRQVRTMASSFITPASRAVIAPLPLKIDEATVINRGSGRYDLIAPVTNPNRHLTAVDVSFSFKYGEKTRVEHTTIWPGADSFLYQTNVPISALPVGGVPTVEILDVRWQRPDNFKLYTGEVQFPVSNAQVRPVTGLTNASGTRFTATVKNQSVFTFKSLRLGVVLNVGGKPVAVGEVTVEKFKFQEERPIEASWLREIPTTTDVTVFPILNLMDSENIL